MKDELIKNIAGGIDLPKRAFDNAELLLKKLFGSVVEEMGGIMGDAIRSRRFKNQVNIFSKAQESLKSKGVFNISINNHLIQFFIAHFPVLPQMLPFYTILNKLKAEEVVGL
eukprot:gene2550-3453_t